MSCDLPGLLWAAAANSSRQVVMPETPAMVCMMNLIKGKFCDQPYLVLLVLVLRRPRGVCGWVLRIAYMG